VTNPDQALKRLLLGNDRFVAGRLDHPGRHDVRRAEQAEHQTPFAVILGCSDSRVPPSQPLLAPLVGAGTVNVVGAEYT